ncbi:P-loop containing nucleoside triphosphate hydrolase protein [Hesseltinella vesiculosa]|uniref:P-loop containing nucleoside triphosphate hydrolase protein n=1 Tax=Hesseltinella vesiculosa TaxID=101127 RepID=A0A1X2GS09_9FUNG|nr:P-loop containing nucleoside triphosphate hydrolase protein [Hesseltinella vesiculosa]
MDPDFLEQCVLIANAEERLHSYVKPLSIWDNMMEYQRQGVHDALLKQGRVLLADEMGLGKSIQALAIAIAYPEHWPILIICPSSLLMTWSDQIQQWLPFTNQDIRLTLKGSSLFGHIPAPLYEMATKNIYHLTQANYNIAICDESHQLKNPKTNRTRELTPLLKKAKVVVMLSGTPALSRPIELFPQLHILNQTLFPNMHQFGVQYCEAHQTRYGWNYQGGSNLSELHFILEKSVMIRRLKDEVQLALPTKTRHIVHLNVAPEQLIQYVATSQAKIPAILQYLDEWLLSTDEKVIVFAYHLHVVDALACYLAKHQIKFVRMDGNTKQTERHRLCQEFQRSGDIQVALLTITAMNVGMNFQAASKVIFAEIYWNPSHLLQAEDRVHRIGQMNSVQIKYLLAMQTAADFMMWSMLMKKLKVVGDVLGKDHSETK